jgi:hypothetical protein
MDTAIAIRDCFGAAARGAEAAGVWLGRAPGPAVCDLPYTAKLRAGGRPRTRRTKCRVDLDNPVLAHFWRWYGKSRPACVEILSDLAGKKQTLVSGGQIRRAGAGSPPLDFVVVIDLARQAYRAWVPGDEGPGEEKPLPRHPDAETILFEISNRLLGGVPPA